MKHDSDLLSTFITWCQKWDKDTANTHNMERFNPPSSLEFEGNISEHWKKWKQELEFYITATEKDNKDDKVKSSILLTCIGQHGREIYNTFSLTEENKLNFDHILDKFEEYCSPKKNMTLIRHKFLSYKQREGQTFSEFLTQLRKLSTDCEFGELKDSLIRDIIVIGILDKRVQERLLRESELTLKRAIEISTSSEQTKQHTEALRQESDVSIVNKSYNRTDRSDFRQSSLGKSNYSQAQGVRNMGNSVIKNCRYCGGTHSKGRCPAYHQVCRRCNKEGHFAKVCLSKPINVVNVADEEEESFVIDTIAIMQISNNTSWEVQLKSNGTMINYKLDTGAQVNVIPFKTLSGLRMNPKLQPTRVKLTAYNGTAIPVRGQCNINIQHNQQQHQLPFIVSDADFPAILGLASCKLLNLITRVMEVTHNQSIFEEFSDCFGEIGTLPKTHHMTVDESITPVVHAARRVPFALKDKLKCELDRMVNLDVIETITEPTDWVSQLVVVEKPNGKLRVCLDPRDLNKAIKRQHYNLPTAEELFAEMAGARYFTKLDASSGYWQIKVDEESSKLLTFSTPFGRYRFKRLPFGIHSASEIFQQTIADIIETCEGARNSQDDIIVWGSTKEELQTRTRNVLLKIRESQLKLNKLKCTTNVTEITFLGHKLSGDGLRPDPEKVQAISDMPEPQSKADLQRFLGMVAYLSKFIPHLSDETLALRQLISKNTLWQFDQGHSKQFNHLKEIISNNILLKFFDPKLPTKVTCDSSKTGLGATLKQQIEGTWHPIAFKSRPTTPAEKNYCPLERETLAIVFGCSKFHDYLYGRQFTVESDHKPLKSIFNNPMHKAPARIQNFMLFLQKYDFHIEYIEGTSIEMCSTDTISRATPQTTNEPEIPEAEIKVHVHQIISSLPITDRRLQSIRTETDKDEALQIVKQHIQEGWPSTRKDLKENVKPFFNIRDELNTVEGLILKGSRIVIPKSLIADIKKQLHVGHLGIMRTKDNARNSVYWPCIDADINNMIESCASCQHHRNKQQKETLIPHEVPPRVWSKVGTDLFTCLNHDYVLVVDYTSKYFDMHHLPDLKASTVIKKTKSIFARYGIPEEVFSDNGSQYSSRAYKDFAKQWNFTHTTSSPEFPQSNGLVERAIQTIKRTLIKCKETNSDPYLALLALKTTINSTNTSPDQVLFNRKLRTTLPKMMQPIQTDAPKPNISTQATERYNRAARDLKPLHQGQTVRYHHNGKWSRHGMVVNNNNGQPRSYLLVNDEGNTIRRNRRHIIPSKDEFNIHDNGPDEGIEHEEPQLIETQSPQLQVEHSSETELQQTDILEETEETPSPEVERTELKPDSNYKTRAGRTIRLPQRFR